MFVPSANSASKSRLRSWSRGRCSRVAIVVNSFVKAVRWSISLSTSSRSITPQRLTISRLSASSVAGSRCLPSRGTRIPHVSRAGRDLHPACLLVAQRLGESTKRGIEMVAQLLDERVGSSGFESAA